MSRRAPFVRRVLFALAAAGFMVLWVRSYSGSDYLERWAPGAVGPSSVTHHTAGVQWTLGQVRLARGEHTVYLPAGYAPPPGDSPARTLWRWGRLGPFHEGWARVGGTTCWNRLGFCRYMDGAAASFYDQSEQGIALPAWLPVLACLMPLTLWLAGRWRADRRRRRGLCPVCCYDLRASPGRCPECGTLVAAAGPGTGAA